MTRVLALLSVLFLMSLFMATPGTAQAVRPVPYPVMEGPRFERAIENGTRTRTGHPGPNYWLNTATYDMDVVLSPDTRTVRATSVVTYTNASPDTLRVLPVHLRQNLHAEGVVRNRPQALTGGVHLGTVSVNDAPLVERTSARQPGYVVNGTRMTLVPAEPVLPGQTVRLGFTWSFEVPGPGAPRMGTDGEMFFVAYWYPQLAVYDDVKGWNAEAYMGNGEFYMGFADYDVRITAPDGWLVGATGVLSNPDDVLTDAARDRLRRAASEPDVVHVVTESDLASGTATRTSDEGHLTWHFRAERVRDFSFASSNRYLWDATHADTGDGGTSMIHALYRPEAAVWQRSAEFGRYSIEFLSRQLGLPYPYPHMTAVEGVVGGGMEFPMMTHIGGSRSDRALFGVTFHEIAHMWFPMIVGSNEKAFTWMDEGLTSFNTNEATADFWGVDAWNPAGQGYYRIAGTGDEVEPMRHGDQYPLDGAARGLASYSKPAVALHALRGMIGDERFYEAYQEYARRWAYRHPQPYDLFNTFEDVLGRDLDWFWTPLFFETWTLDHAVESVTSGPGGVVVRVADRGLTPYPAHVRVTYDDDMTIEMAISADFWLEGSRLEEVTFQPGRVVRVEIDPDGFAPDVDRSNNVWTASPVR